MRDPIKIQISTKSDRERILAAIQSALVTEFKSAMVINEGGITTQALQTLPESISVFLVSFQPPAVPETAANSGPVATQPAAV